MDDPSKEENNNCCSNQGIDAVVNNNTQEETSLLVTLCDVAAVIIIISQRSSPQQMQSYHSATNIIATNMLNWYRTHHITPLHHNGPDHFCNERNCDERNRIASHTNGDQNKQHLTATNRTAIIAITSYRIVSHCIGRQQTTKNHTGPEQTKL